MLGLIIFLIFIFIVLFIVVMEIRNERRYQEKRRQRRDKKNTRALKPKTKHTSKPKKEQVVKPAQVQIKASQNTPSNKKLPICTYPKFTHARLVEMGLSDEESVEFVQELIPQLEIQIPLIEEQLEKKDFHQLERLTHSIKGSASNLGTGGISDLLVEYNTYLKTGTDSDISKTYFEYLKHYTQELRTQYL